MTAAAGFEPGKSDNSVPKTEKSSGGPAVDVVAELTNIADFPQNKSQNQWAFGIDDTFSAALTPAVATPGLAMDATKINTEARTLLVEAGAATNYDYEVLGGRNNDITSAASLFSASAVTAVNNSINIPSSYGFFPWIFLKITNNSGNATYKAVLLGKG